jgi:hypothetical protein
MQSKENGFTVKTVCPDPCHKREKSVQIDLCLFADIKNVRQKDNRRIGGF